MVLKHTITRHEFLNRHGDKVGYCELDIETFGDNTRAHIDAEMPHYSEYTSWSDVAEATAAFNRDILEYRHQCAMGVYD